MIRIDQRNTNKLYNNKDNSYRYIILLSKNNIFNNKKFKILKSENIKMCN